MNVADLTSSPTSSNTATCRSSKPPTTAVTVGCWKPRIDQILWLLSSLRLMDWSRREETTMDVNELMQQTRDTLTVSRVFGESYEHNGTVVVPVAAVLVAGGGGGGHGGVAGQTVPAVDPAREAGSALPPSLPAST